MLFVGDGKRDFVTVPRIVENVLGITIQEETRAWARLHSAGKKFDRKLLFALSSAASSNSAGIVATVDTDRVKKGKRLKELVQARDKHRTDGHIIRMALGEATPHGEAWLLDDAVAVRETLGLDSQALIPNVARSSNPKLELKTLHRSSPRQNDQSIEVLAGIAKLLKVERCTHAESTGFKDFVEDVQSEFSSFS